MTTPAVNKRPNKSANTPHYTNRRIVCAAMLMQDGLIVTGVRHFSDDMRAVLKRLYGDQFHTQVKEQGFIDAKSNFVSRTEAWVLADRNGQICIYDPTGVGPRRRQMPNQGTVESLFSENLY